MKIRKKRVSLKRYPMKGRTYCHSLDLNTRKNPEKFLLTKGCPTPALFTIWVMSVNVRLVGRSHRWTVWYPSVFPVCDAGVCVITLRIPLPGLWTVLLLLLFAFGAPVVTMRRPAWFDCQNQNRRHKNLTTNYCLTIFENGKCSQLCESNMLLLQKYWPKKTNYLCTSKSSKNKLYISDLTLKLSSCAHNVRTSSDKIKHKFDSKNERSSQSTYIQQSLSHFLTCDDTSPVDTTILFTIFPCCVCALLWSVCGISLSLTCCCSCCEAGGACCCCCCCCICWRFVGTFLTIWRNVFTTGTR